MTRSLLFVPGDSPRKLEKGWASGADALIVDLEDSVAPGNKGKARYNTLSFLRERGGAPSPLIYVRINAFDTGYSDGDLDVIMTGAPHGVVLPKAGGGRDVALLASRLSTREALHDLADEITQIIALATETPAAIFTCGTYAAAPRLAGLTWGAEDLGAAIGALATRTNGGWTEPFRLARNLCLFGAAAAGVAPIDTVYTDFRDMSGLRSECEAAARDGFTGKLAIHPAQVPVINEAFTPAAEEVEHAKRVVAAFANATGHGVTSLDGKMLDRPHRIAAERLIARARAIGR